MPASHPSPSSVAIVTLGCARNEVDSEELASRLIADGWTIVDDPASASAVLVNTCGFVESAKKDSIDAVLELADAPSGTPQPKVVAVGCLAERYGRELSAALPEADAVLSFDDYPDIASRLRDVVDGERVIAHEPTDRRRLMPITPVARSAAEVSIPGHGQRAEPAPEPADDSAGSWPSGREPQWQPPVLRHRLGHGPVAPVKLASGCDRRCSFCAIPSFRGSFVSRPPGEILQEAAWLADQGVREIVLVSENSTSYGKDLGDVRALEALLAELERIEALDRIRIAYLQPAEVRPSLIEAMAAGPKVADYFDLSFQHASGPVLRRMRRFGDADSFLGLISRIRDLAPDAGIRSNVIVGFPGETEQDLEILSGFLQSARLDAIGVFGYSDEDGTEAASLPGKLSDGEIRDRVGLLASTADEIMCQRAEDRIGEGVVVLVESLESGEGSGRAVGRAAHQGPDDATTSVIGYAGAVGDLVRARVADAEGVDLVARRG
ncbi:MAG: 30S ribosomal protein S12 methylthiotransferase RimO [Actinomycetales bacterium]|nr:30S ribosomal protein S12 methylthiotransferase RimO [Actinomycetales bacterium]